MGTPKRLPGRAFSGLRSWHVRGFKEIRIFYLVSGDELRIVRVLHGKRDIERILSEEGL